MRRLEVDAATVFVLAGSSRILRENDPDRSPGPRLYFVGCAGGNLCLFRHDVPETTSRPIQKLLGGEPPWTHAQHRPAQLQEIIALLSRDAQVVSVEVSLTYILPKSERPHAKVEFVCSDTREGEALLGRWARYGMPAHMLRAGFATVGDLWAPWCAAVEEGVIAAIAFAARLGKGGAEVGVYTFAGFRGRGLAAVATARWSSLAALEGRELFYGTSVTNVSSQRVAARLGLHRFGMGLRIA